MKDVGKPKAVVAAARVMERVAGVEVEAHFCRIEEKDQDWYRQFHIIALGLDSVEARPPALSPSFSLFLTRPPRAGSQLHQQRGVRVPRHALPSPPPLSPLTLPSPPLRIRGGRLA